MKIIPAIATLCKALAQIITASFPTWDRSTAALMTALADWVREHE